ncbi:MAG: hypothetical protein HUU34_05195 [Saprospiraceae bacterium]|nr:hypothetical protein [Saprospiraceae bacterium]
MSNIFSPKKPHAMGDMKKGDPNNRPLDPKITIVLSRPPAHNNFDRHLSFQDHTGAFIRLKVSFKKISGLTWGVSAFPDGIEALQSLVYPGNRSYWDRMYLENRGGDTTLHIKHLKIVMCYNNPSGSSPDVSKQIVNGLNLSLINHAEIPIVDWDINMPLLSGYDKIELTEFRKRSLYRWAGVTDDDPDFVRAAIEDCGKSGSDGSDQYGKNPKYAGDITELCSEFVSWYYYEHGIKVNGKSLKDITSTKTLHELFKAEKKLYRYNSGTSNQYFINDDSGETYVPKSGDYLERRGPDGAEHSMLIYRWVPKDPNATKADDKLNQILVINGPWPVTLRLVKIHKEEKMTGEGYPKDYWLGRVD